ncbi:MAG: tRNA lysidine(34) synthetase TilS [Helicobacter sp.]|nr:tRNA lysidine(34) synthetase TilS [Helicobacter sp.]
MIAPKLCATLRAAKNLLAFSAGVDSSALFFLLHERDIAFDIAFVNYHTREQCAQEEAHARNLAQRFHKQCFVYDSPPIAHNFEHNARAVRYAFFESLIEQHGYANLLLAHQLNDRLEWLLLALSRGCGLDSLLSVSEEIRHTSHNCAYTLLRPLHAIPKSALYAYLHARNLPFFEDCSNTDSRHARNALRPCLSALTDSFAPQIARSFAILESERARLFALETLQIERLLLCKSERTNAVFAASKALKRLGYVPTSAQREEMEKQNLHCVLGGAFAVGFAHGFVFVAPFGKTAIPKPLKEQCRKLRIPPLLRPYVASRPHVLERVQQILTFAP